MYTQIQQIKLNLAIAIGIYYFAKVQNWSRWIVYFVCLMIAMGGHQAYMSLMVIFILLIVCVQNRGELKNAFIETFFTLVVALCSSIFNLMQISFWTKQVGDTGRGASLTIDIITSNIKVLVKYVVHFMIDASGLWPRWILLLLCVVLAVTLIKAIMSEKSLLEILYHVALILGVAVLSMAPHIIEANILLSPRSCFSIWTVLSFAAIYVISRIDNDNVTKIIVGIGIALLLINIFAIQDIVASESVVNGIDLYEGQQVAAKIQEYENQSGIIIQKIGVRYDLAPTYLCPFGKYHNYELGARIMATSYSNYQMIGYFLGRQLELTEFSDDVFYSNFENKDWTGLKIDEQVKCIDDTAYVIIY